MMDQGDKRGCYKMRVIEYHDYRTLMGPCFVSFSLPLLVPGVVLTVVGSYGNEHTFATFGGWHITGIVMLTIAVLMLLVGIFLKCFFRPVISADLEEHLTPTSSMITGEKNLAYEHDGNTNSNNSSIGSRNNKVRPTSGTKSAHRVVSTHEATDRPVRRTDKSTSGANGDIHSDQDGLKSAVGAGIPADEHQSRDGAARSSRSHEHISTSRVEQETPGRTEDLVPGPPTYEETVSEHNKIRRKHSKKRLKESEQTDPHSTITETVHGNIRTVVTTNVDASVTEANEPEDDSYDFAEPMYEKKRKKKKKKRRDSGTKPDQGAQVDYETMSQLPELRIKPVLVQDGHPHHHHDLHVHFQSEQESSEAILNVRESQDFEI